MVKAFDSKSNGIFPHRFESCPRRMNFAELITHVRNRTTYIRFKYVWNDDTQVKIDR